MTTKPLTKAQRRVLSFIEVYLSVHDYPPTMREVMANFGWGSTNAVWCHYRALERKGYIFRDASHARALRVLRSA